MFHDFTQFTVTGLNANSLNVFVVVAVPELTLSENQSDTFKNQSDTFLRLES